MMIYGSVCSGVEAATVAWHPLGWKPAWFCEFDKFPSAVLAHHYPDVPNLDDMTTIEERPEYHDRPINLLVGGTPCQSFSVAGLRKGLDDDRGNLALKFCKILRDKQPDWFVWENVPGVFSSSGGRDFHSILSGFRECGYGFAYRVLDAQYFGVPQRRRRVFVVGHLGNWQAAAAVLFERESLYGHPAPSRETGQEVAGTLASRTDGGGFPGTDEACSGYVQPEVKPYRMVAFGEYADDDGASALKARDYKDATDLVAHIDGGHISRTLKARHDGSPDPDGKGYDVIAFSHKDNGRDATEEQCPTLCNQHNALSVAYGFKAGQGAKAGGIGYSEEQSPTLTAAESGLNTAPTIMRDMAVRRLTPVECERLQGFPDNYTLVPWRKGMSPDGPRYKAMGNSMAVPVMHWIGQRIDTVDKILRGAA